MRNSQRNEEIFISIVLPDKISEIAFDPMDGDGRWQSMASIRALTWRVESLICHLTQYIEYDCQSDERATRVVGALHGALFLALFRRRGAF
jgi:hypothetical protein